MVVLLWLISFLAFYMVLYVMYKQRFSRIGRMAATIPGPRLAFLVGNAFEFGNNPVEYFKGLVKIAADYGDVVRIWLGTSLYIIVSDLKDIEFILSSNTLLDKAEFYEFIQEGWLGNGLATADDEKWRPHRKILMPVFHIKILEEFIEVFLKNSNILTRKLKSEVGKPSFDIDPYISSCTLDTVCESVMGTAVNAQLDPHCEFHEAIRNVTTAAINRLFKPWLYPAFLFNISSTGRLYRRSTKYIREFVDQVIEKKKKLYEERKLRMKESEKHADQNGCRKRHAFLDLMLEYLETDNETYSDNEVRDEVNSFMFAGHDTVSTTISFALYNIAQHPDVQEEIVRELAEIFGNSDREETFQDIQNMKYLERVLKESARMYTVAVTIGRRLTQDVTMPSGYNLPKGASILLFLYRLHHNPQIYPNPEEFNPDNFLPERVQNRSQYAYCPFSAGPRNCIGQKFAMLQMKAILSSILRKYKLFASESGPEVVISLRFLLQSETGIHIRIEKRM